MKRLATIIILMSLSISVFGQDAVKRYPFKSGMIEFKHSGTMKGTEIMYWDDYGNKEVHFKDYKINFLGMKTKKKEVELTLGDVTYKWEDGKKSGTKTQNPYLAEAKEAGSEEWQDVTGPMLDSLGFKQIENATVNGKDCEVYKGSCKYYVWEGLPMKVSGKFFGMKINMEATKVETDIDVDQAKFELPKKVSFTETKFTMEKDSDVSEKELMKKGKKLLKGLFK